MAVILAALVVLLSAGTSEGSARNHHSLYWGATIGTQITGEQAPYDMRATAAFERAAGKKVSIIAFAASFVGCPGSGGGPCTYNEFPTTPLETIRNHGAIPLYSWSSSSTPTTARQSAFQLRDVAAGRYDDYIRRTANKAREWGHPFFLRFNWEMNGFWFPWGVKANGNRTRDYVRAWRHVHDIFTAAGADNVSWVWCPNAESRRRGIPLKPLYPGAKYVDWTGMDGFNWGKRAGSTGWRSLTEVFSRTYKRIRQIAPGKPMMLAETASSDRGGSKAGWIRNALRVLPVRFPKIRALVWFDVNDRGTHWPIEHSGRVTRAFRNGIRRGIYRPNVFGQISQSPIRAPR